MTVNRKVTGTALTMPMGICLGCGISMILTILGAGLVAKLISIEMIPETSIGYGAMMIILVASICGALIAVHKVKKRMLQVSGAVGMAYFASLLAITAIFFGGQYQGMGVTALLILSGCGVVVLMEGRDKKAIKFRKGRRAG